MEGIRTLARNLERHIVRRCVSAPRGDTLRPYCNVLAMAAKHTLHEPLVRYFQEQIASGRHATAEVVRAALRALHEGAATAASHAGITTSSARCLGR